MRSDNLLVRVDRFGGGPNLRQRRSLHSAIDHRRRRNGWQTNAIIPIKQSATIRSAPMRNILVISILRLCVRVRLGAPTQEFRLIVISINHRRLEITLCYTSDSTTLLNRIRTITGLLRYSENDGNGELALRPGINMRNRARRAFWSLRDRLEMPQGEMRAKDLRREVAELRSVRPNSRLPMGGLRRFETSVKSANAQIAAIRRGLGEPPTGGRRYSSRYSRYDVSTSSIHFMNARTRRDRLLRCATTRETASARRRKSGRISTSAPLSKYRPTPKSGA